MSTKKNLLFIIILTVLAAVFYFWGLDRHDVINDEASYMTRGIGMLDFNFGIEQPTPIQWVKEVPWWMKFSFHDHPLLVFFLENISFRVFGENVFAGRIPPVLAGLLAVLFVYLIAKELYSYRVGLVSAALFAFTVNHVWVSRTALQESILTVLMLAVFYVFLKALANKKLLVFVGVLIGLAFLVKYTALILAPIFLTILILKRRDYFKSVYFLLSILCFLIIASPVVIYNIGLYKTFGHFDFQISYIVGQKVEAWNHMPGKESIGTFGERIKNYVPALLRTNSPIFLALSIFGLGFAVFQTMRKGLAASSHTILLVFFLWIAAFMLVIGPTYRFLTMLGPWFSIFAGFFIIFLAERIFFFSPLAAKLLFFTVLIGETLYAYNSVIALAPLGKTPWAYAAIRMESNNWGYNQLENFIASELSGKRPEIAVGFNYPVIYRALEEAVEKDTRAGLQPERWAIVYNGNIHIAAQLWTFLRRAVYHGWPIMDADWYGKITAEKGADYLKKLGIEKIYFINNTDKVVLREVKTRPFTSDGDIIEQALRARGIAPREIRNLNGEIAFKVYEVAP